MPTYFNQKQIAEMLELSEGRISQLRDEGMPWTPAQEHENQWQIKMRPKAVIDWLIQRELAKWQVKTEQATGMPIAEAERRKTIAEWEIKRAHADELNGVSVNADDALRCWSEMLVTFRAQVEALAGRLAKQLALIDDPAEIRQAILVEGRRACDSAANIAVVFLEAERTTVLAEAAAGSGGVAVGRGQADTAER